MDCAPTTSTTMLRQIAGEPAHPRWSEFYRKYRPMLASYAAGRFPELEASDLIQETLLGVMKALPGYVDREVRKGSFHNFLVGILHHKALDAVQTARRRTKLHDRMCRRPREAEVDPTGTEAWQHALFDVALSQLLADPKIPEKSKQIFQRTLLKHEKPQEVAESLLTSRAAVDQTNKRMRERLRKIVKELEHACE